MQQSVFKDKDKSDETILFKIGIQGGIVGINREILIKGNGEALFVDKKEKEKRLFNIDKQELKEFNELLHKINNKIVGEPYPDCFAYKIQSGEKEVIIYPSPEKQAPEIIKLINKWLEVVK